jgi:hypothetical protein
VLLLRSLLAAALAVLCLTSCQTYPGDLKSDHYHYFLIRNTDYRGEVVADWIAQGPVVRTPEGYKFHAVEHDTAPPFPQQIHYPDGRSVEISGPNLVVRPCGQPYWLYKLRHGY